MPDIQPVYTSADTPSRAKLLWRFFIPTLPELLTYTLIATVLLCLVNLWGIIGLITGDTNITAVHISEALQAYNEQIDAIFNQSFLAHASLIIVWGIVGCIAYMIAWVAKGYFTHLYEDVEASHDIRPRATQNTNYWQSVIGHNIFFGCTVFVALAYAIVCLSAFIPACLQLFSHSLESWFTWQSLAGCLGSIFGLVLLFQVGRILGRLIHNSWKIFFSA